MEAVDQKSAELFSLVQHLPPANYSGALSLLQDILNATVVYCTANRFWIDRFIVRDYVGMKADLSIENLSNLLAADATIEQVPPRCPIHHDTAIPTTQVDLDQLQHHLVAETVTTNSITKPAGNTVSGTLTYPGLFDLLYSSSEIKPLPEEPNNFPSSNLNTRLETNDTYRLQARVYSHHEASSYIALEEPLTLNEMSPRQAPSLSTQYGSPKDKEGQTDKNPAASTDEAPEAVPPAREEAASSEGSSEQVDQDEPSHDSKKAEVVDVREGVPTSCGSTDESSDNNDVKDDNDKVTRRIVTRSRKERKASTCDQRHGRSPRKSTQPKRLAELVQSESEEGNNTNDVEEEEDSDEDDFKHHELGKVPPQNSYECFICQGKGASYKKKDFLHHFEAVHVVTLQDTDVKNTPSVEKHILPCPQCQKGFKVRQVTETVIWYAIKTCLNHMVSQHSIPIPSFAKIYKCQQCTFMSLCREIWVHHRRRHGSDLRQIQCDYCGKILCKASLSNHLKVCKARLENNSRQTFHCNFCSQVFASKGSMITHHNRLHQKQQMHLCSACPASFFAKTDLERHMFSQHKVNISKRQVSHCPVCNFQTLQGSLLRKHMRNHEFGTFPCDVCGKSFGTQNRLKTHRRIHTAAKKHQCPHCEYITSKKYHLDRHIAVRHLGAQWRCKECAFLTVSEDNLKRHMERSHDEYEKSQVEPLSSTQISGYRKERQTAPEQKLVELQILKPPSVTTSPTNIISRPVHLHDKISSPSNHIHFHQPPLSGNLQVTVGDGRPVPLSVLVQPLPPGQSVAAPSVQSHHYGVTAMEGRTSLDTRHIVQGYS